MRKVRKCHLEQLNLFDEKPSRPKLTGLPIQKQDRVRELVAQILIESLKAHNLSNDRKEVVNER